MQTDKDIPGISCGLVDNNVFEWEVMLMISDECKFYGGTSACAWLPMWPVPILPKAAHTTCRWLLPHAPLLSTRIPAAAAKDEV